MRSSSQDLPQPYESALRRLERHQTRSQVASEIEILGPSNANRPRFTVEQSERYCRNLAAKHYENFTVITYLFPTQFRQHIANIYAFCRWADDLADETSDPNSALELLDWWQQEFTSGLTARTRSEVLHPALIAVHKTISNFDIPPQLFLDLLDAFRQDQSKVRYQNDAEVADYCKRSANPVGRILLNIAGCREQTHLKLSDQVCTGLQIANFCQDIRQDAMRGRIYLPQTRWRPAGLSEQDFIDGFQNPSQVQVLKEWVLLAQQHLHAGAPLVTKVPLWLARNLQMFIRGGLAITQAISQSNYDVWADSPKVTKRAKLSILFRGLMFPRSQVFPTLP